MVIVLSNKTTEALLVAVAQALLTAWLVLMVPHYDQTMNRIRTGTFCTLTGLAAAGFGMSIARPQGATADYLTGATLLSLPLLFAVGFRLAGEWGAPCSLLTHRLA